MPHNRTKRGLMLGGGVAVFLLSLALGSSPWSWGQKSAARATSPLGVAKTQLEKGELEAAEETLWKILGPEPANEQALTMLGVIRGRQQRYAEAEALFKRVLQVNPKSDVANRNLASALLAQNKPDEAIQQYQQAIKFNPQDTGLRVEVARLELARRNFGSALAALEGIPPARFPAAAIPLKAACLMGVGRKVDAEGLLARAHGFPDIALGLAQVFVDAQDPEAALKALSLIKPMPKSMAAQAAFVRGQALRQKGNTAEAISSFRAATTADPKSLESLLAMAETLAAENKHAESVALLQKARGMNPESREVLRAFIVEGMKSGQNDRALQAAQELQRASTELSDRFLIASVMLQQKQFLPATHILEDFVAQRPDDAKALLGLGIAYLNLLRYPEARQALERSLQLKPDMAESEFQLGMLASQEGKRSEAMQRWKKAVELQPRHAQALFSLGTVYLETGELDEAEKAFSGSLAADPRNMKTEYNLALVQNKLGKSDEAKQHFEHYRKMQEQEHTENGNPRGADPK